MKYNMKQDIFNNNFNLFERKYLNIFIKTPQIYMIHHFFIYLVIVFFTSQSKTLFVKKHCNALVKK